MRSVNVNGTDQPCYYERFWPMAELQPRLPGRVRLPAAEREHRRGLGRRALHALHRRVAVHAQRQRAGRRPERGEQERLRADDFLVDEDMTRRPRAQAQMLLEEAFDSYARGYARLGEWLGASGRRKPARSVSGMEKESGGRRRGHCGHHERAIGGPSLVILPSLLASGFSLASLRLPRYQEYEQITISRSSLRETQSDVPCAMTIGRSANEGAR